MTVCHFAVVAFGTRYHFASWYVLPLRFVVRVTTSFLDPSDYFGILDWLSQAQVGVAKWTSIQVNVKFRGPVDFSTHTKHRSSIFNIIILLIISIFNIIQECWLKKCSVYVMQ